MQHIINGPRGHRSGEPRGVTTDPPLVSGEPIREWAFSELRGDSLAEVELDDGIQVGGLLHELHDFGPTFRDSDVIDPDGTSLPPDGIATGQIASTADRVTYWSVPRPLRATPTCRRTRSVAARGFDRPSRSSSGTPMRRCRSR